MGRNDAPVFAAPSLNERCHCLNVELGALRHEVERRLGEAGMPANLASSHPHLFSSTPVFVGANDARRMADVVRAVEAAIALPAYREAVLAWAPDIANYDSGARGAFLGFDFHLSAYGPKLIEINTNAGGGFLAAMLGDATVACCGTSVPAGGGTPDFEQAVVKMLLAEWRSAGRSGSPRTIAIVDDAPTEQYLYPEFLLARAALRHAGIEAVIAAPGGERVDMIYNRLTDFALAAPEHAGLREAYLSGATVVTPNPRAHALYADKRALGLLCDESWLRAAGLDGCHAALLAHAVPHTAPVLAQDGGQLWSRRKSLFFKPVAGYGSRGAYRGDKLTRKVFEAILAGGYVAQALVPPGQRSVVQDDGAPMKFDVRNYAYDGGVQLLAARLWQGQTTNFRSEGGGFAPVLVLP
ncbi:MAG: hypothetical protein EXR31_00160 [Betaproteobacteria bacterium]|nr:hypothetical protein [Betaproteobacteria bacterium]